MRDPLFRFLAPIAVAAAVLSASAATADPSGAADPKSQTVYVPGALAGSDPQIWTLIWALNNGSESALVRPLTKWDPAGEHDLSLADPLAIAPGGTAYLISDTVPDPQQAVQFLALSVPAGVVIRPMLQRSIAGNSAGALTLPFFTSLVPANTRSVAGNFRSSYVECTPPGTPRRLNVTLFNAGDVEATFHVAVATRTNGIRVGPPEDRETRTDFDYVVPPRTVQQINAVPYDVGALCEGWLWGMGWVEITADQPYLAYASTVRQDGPGILPYEVFPALTGHELPVPVDDASQRVLTP